MTRGRRARMESWRALIDLAAEGDRTAIAELRQVRREAGKVLPKPPKRERESPELGATVARFVAALVARAEAGDLEAVVELRKVRTLAARAVPAAMVASRRHYTLDTIAQETGMTKQAVFKATDGRKSA